MIRPTNGEINRTFASAHATACANENSSVRLQWMPSRSRISAARMPSHVEAILMRTRSRPMPFLFVKPDEFVSLGDERVRVEGKICVRLCGDAARHDLQNFQAEQDQQLVHDRVDNSSELALDFLLSAMAWSISRPYSGICAAFKISDGLVVASRGAYCFSVAKSPVSATTTVNCFNWSSWLGAVCPGAFGVSTAVLIIVSYVFYFLSKYAARRAMANFLTPRPRRLRCPPDFLYGHTLSRLRPRRRQRPAHARHARQRQNLRRRTASFPKRSSQDQRRAALGFRRVVRTIESRPEKSRRERVPIASISTDSWGVDYVLYDDRGLSCLRSGATAIRARLTASKM